MQGQNYEAFDMNSTLINWRYYFTTMSQNILTRLLIKIQDVLFKKNITLAKTAEALALSLRLNQPQNVFEACLDNLLTKTIPKKGKQLRQILLDFPQETFDTLWWGIKPLQQVELKLKLFLTTCHHNEQMKEDIISAIGELFRYLSPFENEAEQKEFETQLAQLLQKNLNNNANHEFVAILKRISKISENYLKGGQASIPTFLELGLQHRNILIKSAAIRNFSFLLNKMFDPKQAPALQKKIPSLCISFESLVTNDRDENNFSIFFDLVSAQLRFFKNHLKQLMELLNRLSKLRFIQLGTRKNLIRLSMDLVNSMPARFRKQKNLLVLIVSMTLRLMVDIKENIMKKWLVPLIILNQEDKDEDAKIEDFGRSVFDNLMQAIGQEMLPILSNSFAQLLANDDWRYKYTALMMISQIGEHIEDIDMISSVLQMVLNFCKDTNPKLRYAACHVIGQISDDRKFEFQSKYGNAVLPELITLLQNDPVPHVVAHAASALNNFLQGVKYEQIESNLDTITKILIYHAINGIGTVKTCVYGTISSLVEVARQHFQPYLEQILKILFNYFQATKFRYQKYVHEKESAIETMSIIAFSVGPNIFRPAAPKTFQIMVNLLNKKSNYNPSNRYVVASWTRLCRTYKKQLVIYLDKILPNLFYIAHQLLEDPQEVLDTINLIHCLAEQLQQLFLPYISVTVSELFVIIKRQNDLKIKQKVFKCFNQLIKVLKTQNEGQAIILARQCITNITQTLQSDNYEITLLKIQCLQHVFETLNSCFLSQSQVSQFQQNLLRMISYCDSIKEKIKADMDGKEEEDQQDAKDLIEKEEKMQVAVSEVIGALFKTHKNMTLPFANYLITNILPSIFIPEQSEQMLIFGIFLIDDMVDHFGYQLLIPHWISFSNIFLNYLKVQSHQLRHAVNYGLGVLALNSPNSVLNSQTVILWLNSLIESVNLVNIPIKDKKGREYNNCQDNAIAAIGKILKNHSNLIDPTPYLHFWVNKLPLRYDKEEAIIQHEFFVDILLRQPELLIGTDQITGMQVIISTLANISGNKKIYNEATAAKMKEFIFIVRQLPFFKDNIMIFWGSLTEEQRNKLIKFMA